MKKRIFITLLASALLLNLCSACAVKPGTTSTTGDNSKPVSQAEGNGGEDVTVTVISVNDASKTFHKDIIPIFEKENAGIKVNFIEVPFDQFDTKIQTMLASKTPLDLTTHNGWTGFGGRLANDQLLALDPYIEKYGFDAEAVNIPQEASDVWKSNGKTYAIPVHIFPSVMMYNKDMFDAEGLEYPPASWEDGSWTWDKMIEYAQQLTKNADDPINAQYGLSWNWDCGGHEQMPQYFGHKTFDEATFTTGEGFASEAYFNDPEVVKDYQKVLDLTYKSKVSPNAATNEAMGGNAFYAGKCAMYVGGAWMLAGTNELPFNVGISAIPNGGNDEVRDTMWIDPYWIFKDSKCPDEAFQYLAFMLKDDIQIKIVEVSAGLAPANMKAFDAFASSFSKVDAADMRIVFDGGIKYGFEGMSHLMVDSSSLNTLITNETDPMFKEGKPAAEILPTVQEKMSQFIKDTKGKYAK